MLAKRSIRLKGANAFFIFTAVILLIHCWFGCAVRQKYVLLSSGNVVRLFFRLCNIDNGRTERLCVYLSGKRNLKNDKNILEAEKKELC
jgi:hypothetical protein